MPGTSPAWRMRRAARDPEGARLVTSRRVRLLAAMRPGMVPNRLPRLLADLRGGLEELLHGGERGLRLARETDQALAEERRHRVGVPTGPAGAHLEVLERPPDRPAEPWRRRQRVQLGGRELRLELVGAALVDRPVAVGLGAELGDHQR